MVVDRLWLLLPSYDDLRWAALVPGLPGIEVVLTTVSLIGRELELLDKAIVRCVSFKTIKKNLTADLSSSEMPPLLLFLLQQHRMDLSTDSSVSTNAFTVFTMNDIVVAVES